MTKQFCAKCVEETPHRMLYVRTHKGTTRTWKEALSVCEACLVPVHIIRPVYQTLKLTGEERFDSVLRLAKAPIDFQTLAQETRDTKLGITEAAIRSNLAYLTGAGFVREGSKDYTEEVLSAVNVTKNFAVCSQCGKSAVLSLLASVGRKFVPVGSICLACRHVEIRPIGGVGTK